MKELKKFCMLFVIMLMVSSLTMIHAGAFIGEDINEITNTDEEVISGEQEALELNAEQNDLGNAETETEIQSHDIQTKVTTFDVDAFNDALKTGVTQASYLDLADYYDGDADHLEIEFIKGRAYTDGARIFFNTAGTVSFIVTDRTETVGTFTVEVVANPILGIAFDKMEATIVIGESVDFIISILPEDGRAESDLTLSATYEGTGSVRLEAILDESNAGYIIGYRAYGVSAGSGKLIVNIEDDEYIPAIADITVLGGTITPITNVQSTAHLETMSFAPATNDTTTTAIYTTMLGASVLTLGYIYLTKKRNLLKR